jgi:putative addiction module killer protein
MTDVSILHYRTVEGRFPYREWVESIADKSARAAVLARVDRLAFGTFGDWKAVGEGVCELRVHVSAGYRVFFGRDGNTVVILLCGGMKRSQDADIRRARKYWKDYETRKEPPGGRSR